METITIHDKRFRLYLPAEKLLAVIGEMAGKMNQELAGKEPLFVCVLNGAFIFASELFRRITLPGAEITFVKMASYHGTHSSGVIHQLIGLNDVVENRTVVVLEDIVDSGRTIENMICQLKELKPREIMIAALLLKPAALIKEVSLDYVGLEIPNDFIVGFGLDYDGYGRNLPDIYSIVE